MIKLPWSTAWILQQTINTNLYLYTELHDVACRKTAHTLPFTSVP